ncbi:MAG: MdtA/MuxA family multidrug efflux RND transporter periplasmic adaptor subunit [Rhizobiales bacterium]|nr:MdtA/MuxA family multidrug efflux RND transporter periplasmic adaptor subunit [Hyphomicrobiales bacterium]OJY02912.1 MAG: efflux transporter periplasmic adaptor subunit [Rhizobiales bacterium 63-22]
MDTPPSENEHHQADDNATLTGATGGAEGDARRAGRSRGWLPWLIFLLVVAGLAFYFWQRPQQAGPAEHHRRMMQPSSVGAATAEKGVMDVTLDALGTVTSLTTVTVRPQISGQLIAIEFKEGQEVKKGDLLAQIDPRPYQAALAQAQGELARDQALLAGAKVDLQRYKGLAAQNAVARQTLDAQNALVAQYTGTVEADQAAVQAAQVNLAYCRILAPVDGRAGLRQVDQGNYITPSDSNGIVVITQLQPISVLFTVPEDQLPAIAARLKTGAQLPVTAFDRGGNKKLATGTLSTFDSQIDTSTGTIKLKAAFDNADRALFPNQFVNVELLVDQHRDVVIVPDAAVQRGVPGTFVYLIGSDDTVSVRKIETGVTDGVRTEVLSGLAAGDRVVVDGADKLREGMKINVRDDTAQAPAAAAPARDKASGQHKYHHGQGGNEGRKNGGRHAGDGSGPAQPQ